MTKMKSKLIVVLLTAVFMFSICAISPALSEQEILKTINIGVIAPSKDSYNVYKTLFNEIIQPYINNAFAPLKFVFLVENAKGDSAKHLNLVEKFHREGVDLIIGGFWSGQAAASLDYVNANDMLLFSPSSTAPLLAIPNDNLFRLSSDESKQGKVIAEMIWSRGIEKAVVLQNDYMDYVYDVLKTEYENLGGEIIEHITYDTSSYPPDPTFSDILSDAEAAVTGAMNEGVLTLSSWEVVDIVQLAENYPSLYGLPWFGSYTTALFQDSLLLYATEQSVHLKIYSPIPVVSEGSPMDIWIACTVDVSWIIALAVSETQSTSALDVMEAIPYIAGNYHGLTGWCGLDPSGDRTMMNHDIHGFGFDPDPGFLTYGFYDAEYGLIDWY